jgi:V-type H+-transporting ATPase subunit C
VRISKSAFSDTFQAWVHLKALRVHVESVLRYGLPPDFVSAAIKVCPHEVALISQASSEICEDVAEAVG